ncbi:hypothetical protein [Chelativorans sp. J32]|uniref:hypothetical protein n=1 Tax=Chelativorans sp. J32 TaxID=935840 RepID=UPI0004B71B98|nr:hypothetical protein [Chelativorans sp. J32]
MQEPEERTTIVETRDGGGAGAGMIAGIVVAIAAVVLVIFLFSGGLFDGDGEMTSSVTRDAPDVSVETPDIEAPDVDVNIPSNEGASQGGGTSAPAPAPAQ